MIEGILLGLALVFCLATALVRSMRRALARLRVTEQAPVGLKHLARGFFAAVAGGAAHQQSGALSQDESRLAWMISRVGFVRPQLVRAVCGLESCVILAAVVTFGCGAWMTDLEYGALAFLVVAVGGYVLPRAVLRNLADSKVATLHRGMAWFSSTLGAARSTGEGLVLFVAIEQWRVSGRGTAMGRLAGELHWLVTCGVGLNEAIEKLFPRSGPAVVDGLRRLRAVQDSSQVDEQEREIRRAIREDVRIALEHRTARISSVLVSIGILEVFSGLALVWGTVGW